MRNRKLFDWRKIELLWLLIISLIADVSVNGDCGDKASTLVHPRLPQALLRRIRILEDSETGSQKIPQGIEKEEDTLQAHKNKLLSSPLQTSEANPRKLAGLDISQKFEIFKNISALPLDQFNKRCQEIKEVIDKRWSISLSRFLDKKKYDEEDYLNLVCNQRLAGFEAEVKVFPCAYNPHDLLSFYAPPNTNNVIIRNAIAPASEIRFGFKDEPYYTLGYDVTQDYYDRATWKDIRKALLASQTSNNVSKFPPNKNYEFRTIGGLKKDLFMNAKDAFSSWFTKLYDKVIWDNLACKASDNYYICEVGKLNLCLPNYNKANKYPSVNVRAKYQVTISFHIADLSVIIQQIFNLSNFFSHKEYRPFFIPRWVVNQTFNDQKWHDLGKHEKYMVSSIKYLSQFAWDFSAVNQLQLTDQTKHERNFLLLLAFQWFKDVDSDPTVVERQNNSLTNNYLKGYSTFLIRKNERWNISKETVELFLEKVTPFYDIYLPYQVCDRDLPANPTINQRLAKLKIVLDGWEQRVTEEISKLHADVQDQDSLIKQNKLIEQYNTWIKGITYYEEIKKIADKNQSRGSNPLECFKYSLSMYLVDLWVLPDNDPSNQLAINRYYEGLIINQSHREILIPITLVDDKEPTTLTMEYRAIPQDDKNLSESLFDGFVKLFYDRQAIL